MTPPTPKCCVSCRLWTPVDPSPLKFPGAPVVGVCAIATALNGCGWHRWDDGSLSRVLAPVVSRPQDCCEFHDFGPSIGRWWDIDAGEPALAPPPLRGRFARVNPFRGAP